MKMTAAEVQAYADGYRRRINRESWIRGIYTQDALTAIASAVLAGKNKQNVYKYPERPHGGLQPVSEEEKQKEAEEERKKAIAYFNRFAKHKKKLEFQDPEEAERLKAKLYMHQMKWAYKNWGNDDKTNA